MTAFKRSQAVYVKHAFRPANWPEYEASLRQRGSLTAWISEDDLEGWGPPQRGQRRPGGQQKYLNQAIATALTVGMVFHLALRQTEGLLRSLFSLLGVDCRAADHTTISRRARMLGKLPVGSAAGNRPVHTLIDSTGLKIHVGTLRKPPKQNAKVRPEVTVLRERNRNIRSRARLGKRQWHTKSGYSRRSLVENTIFRHKLLIGPTMRSRTLQGQRVEARVGCRILKTMAGLGMPESHRVG